MFEQYQNVNNANFGSFIIIFGLNMLLIVELNPNCKKTLHFKVTDFQVLYFWMAQPKVRANIGILVLWRDRGKLYYY